MLHWLLQYVANGEFKTAFFFFFNCIFCQLKKIVSALIPYCQSDQDICTLWVVVCLNIFALGRTANLKNSMRMKQFKAFSELRYRKHGVSYGYIISRNTSNYNVLKYISLSDISSTTTSTLEIDTTLKWNKIVRQKKIWFIKLYLYSTHWAPFSPFIFPNT